MCNKKGKKNKKRIVAPYFSFACCLSHYLMQNDWPCGRMPGITTGTPLGIRHVLVYTLFDCVVQEYTLGQNKHD